MIDALLLVCLASLLVCGTVFTLAATGLFLRFIYTEWNR